MKSRRVRLAALALTTLVSCGRPAIEENRSSRDLTGYAQAGCAPTDAPAVEIYVSDAPPPRSDAAAWMDSAALLRTLPDESPRTPVDGGTTLARILIWSHASQLAGQELLLSEEGVDWGDVTWCSALGCEPIREGRLGFIRTKPDEIAGEYELALPDGDVLVGLLQATVVEREFAVYCG